MRSGGESLLTLEPLLDAVREGVEEAAWELSGLQKTTSHQFEGRWEGDWTRSAYLFFHRASREDASIDVYLDETSRGLKGNLALVLDGRGPEVTGDVGAVLSALGAVADRVLPEGYRTPVSVRYRIPDGEVSPGRASVEIRFKVRIPGSAIEAGASVVSALSSAVVRSFETLLGEEAVARYALLD